MGELAGGCWCGKVRYRVEDAFLLVVGDVDLPWFEEHAH